MAMMMMMTTMIFHQTTIQMINKEVIRRRVEKAEIRAKTRKNLEMRRNKEGMMEIRENAKTSDLFLPSFIILNYIINLIINDLNIFYHKISLIKTYTHTHLHQFTLPYATIIFKAQSKLEESRLKFA